MKMVAGIIGGLSTLAIGLAAGGLIALSPDIAMPLLVLLLPGLLALAIDRTPGCAVARAILLFQATASLGPVLDAWNRCAGVDGCMSDLASTRSVALVWLAGGAAWTTTQMIPLGLRLLDDRRLAKRRESLVARREELAAQWGLDA